MKFFYILTIILILSGISNAQYEVSASMGINFISTPSLNDYINQNFPTVGESIEGFNSSVVFSAEAGYNVSDTYQAAIEAGYLIYSYTSSGLNGQYEIAYGNLMLTLLNYYVITGEGYNFKFGGGLGVRFLNADESLPGTGVTNTYLSTGYGLLLRVEGNTLLGGNIYAKIGAQAGYDINGEPQNDGEPIRNDIAGENVNFNSLSVGLSLGVSYIF